MAKTTKINQTTYLLLTSIIFIILNPLFGSSRTNTRSACRANLRVIFGAVEMYNMDHKVMMSTLNLDSLEKGGYLKSTPVCRAGGEYLSTGDLTGSGMPFCKYHGFVEPKTDKGNLTLALKMGLDPHWQSNTTPQQKEREHRGKIQFIAFCFFWVVILMALAFMKNNAERKKSETNLPPLESEEL